MLSQLPPTVNKSALAFQALANSIGISTTALAGFSIAGVVVTTALVAIRKYNEQLKEQRRAAEESYRSFSQTESSVSGYVSRIKELEESLESGNLSEEEAIQVRQDLLGIQDEIAESLGDEAAAFDILSDSVNNANASLGNYLASEAQQTLTENAKAYAEAVEQMEKETDAWANIFVGSQIDAAHDVQDVFRSVFGDNFSYDNGVGQISGTATEISSGLDEVISKMYELESAYAQSGRSLSGELNADWRDWINDFREEADEVIDNFGENYDNYIQLRIAAEPDYVTIEDQIAEAKSAYEKALASGDDKEMADALAKVFSLSSITEDIDEKGVADYFDEIISALQSAASKEDAKIKLKADIELDDGSGKYGTIQRALKQFAGSDGTISLFDITSAGQDAQNIRAMGGELTGAAAAYTLLEVAAENYGLKVEDLIGILVEQGVVQGEINDLAEEASGSWLSDDISDGIDEVRSKIDELNEAMENLENGEMTWEDVIDLMKDFPELEKYVDLAAEDFGNLADGLEAAKNSAPTTLIETLEQLKESGNLDKTVIPQVDALINLLGEMPNMAADEITAKYGELADEVRSAQAAIDELNASLSEDTNTGYTTRAKAMDEMMSLMEKGAIGSESKLWKIAESFGLTDLKAFSGFADGYEAAADSLYNLIEARQRWYDGATEDGYSFDGIEAFITDVANATDVLENLGVTWSYVDGELDIDLPNDKWYDFADAIGMGSDELVDMLMQIGQFFGIDWESLIPEDVLNAKIKPEVEQPDPVEVSVEQPDPVEVPVDANKKPADVRMGEWRADQEANKATIPLDTDNTGVDEGVSEAQAVVENATTEPVKLDVDASQAIDKILNVQKLINSIHGKTVTVKAKIDGLAKVQQLIDAIAQVKNKTVTVTSNTTTYSRTVNTSQIQADGTAHANGNWGTPRTERALTGELGREIIVDPGTGRWYTVGDNGAEFVRIPKGAIVFNHKQTEALLKNGYVTGRGQAYASGTAYVSSSGSKKSYSFSGSSSSSSSSKTSSSSSYSSSNKVSSSTASSSSNTELENWFEKQYAYHQHLVAMEQETDAAYLDWLMAAYPKAYKEGIITLEDYYQYQEECFQKLRDIYDDYLNDVEHEVSMREHFKGEEQAILKLYQEAIESVQAEIDEARKAGLTDSDEYIQTLQDRWWTLYDALEDMRNSYTENAKSATDELIDLRKNMIKQGIKDEKDANSARLKNLKEFYQKQKELLKDSYDEDKYLKEQTEKRKAVTDLQMELDRLSYDNSAWAQKRRLELEEDLAKAQEELSDFEKDHALEVAQDQLDELYEKQEAAYNQQNDLLDAKLDNAKALYDQALEDVRNGSMDLYNEMIEYNNIYGDGIRSSITEMWNDAYAALNDYANLYGKTYNQINLANATGYDQTKKSTENAAGSWDTSPISDRGTNVTEAQISAAKAKAESEKIGTWKSNSKGWWYEYGDGTYAKSEWKSINGKWYHFDSKGWMQTGWIKDGSTWYYLNSSGAMQTGWIKLNGTWYYLGKDGKMVTGTQKIDGKSYTFNKSGAWLGYASGTKNAKAGLHRIDERGDEFVFESANGNRYRMFSGGEKVLNAKATDFLYQFATSGGKILTDLIKSSISRNDLDSISNSRQNVDITMGDIIINGNADQRTVSQIRREQREGMDYVLTQFARLKG